MTSLLASLKACAARRSVPGALFALAALSSSSRVVVRILIETGVPRSTTSGNALQIGHVGLRLYQSTRHVAWNTCLQSSSTTFSPLTSEIHTGQMAIFHKGTTTGMMELWGWRPRRGVFSGTVRDGVSFFEEIGRGSYAVVYRGQLDGARSR